MSVSKIEVQSVTRNISNTVDAQNHSKEKGLNCKCICYINCLGDFAYQQWHWVEDPKVFLAGQHPRIKSAIKVS